MNVHEYIQLGIIAVAALISFVGVIGVLCVLKRTQKGFGANSARSFAVAIFLPIVLIIATMTSLGSEAIATLLGTLAGYIFAQSGKE